MSVIGRLDEQVARILIAPLEKQDEEAKGDVSTRDTEARDAAMERRDLKPSIRSKIDDRSDDESLPVWLL